MHTHPHDVCVINQTWSSAFIAPRSKSDASVPTVGVSAMDSGQQLVVHCAVQTLHFIASINIFSHLKKFFLVVCLLDWLIEPDGLAVTAQVHQWALDTHEPVAGSSVLWTLFGRYSPQHNGNTSLKLLFSSCSDPVVYCCNLQLNLSWKSTLQSHNDFILNLLCCCMEAS